jgi:hypothetical protein
MSTRPLSFVEACSLLTNILDPVCCLLRDPETRRLPAHRCLGSSVRKGGSAISTRSLQTCTTLSLSRSPVWRCSRRKEFSAILSTRSRTGTTQTSASGRSPRSLDYRCAWGTKTGIPIALQRPDASFSDVHLLDQGTTINLTGQESRRTFRSCLHCLG